MSAVTVVLSSSGRGPPIDDSENSERTTFAVAPLPDGVLAHDAMPIRQRGDCLVYHSAE